MSPTATYQPIATLIAEIEQIARRHRANRVTGVTVQLGALSHLSVENLKNHFSHAVRNTIAHGARLTIQQRTDIYDPYAQEIILTKVDLQQ